MSDIYYETRKNQPTARALAADIAAHLEARQHTDTTIILCENSMSMLSTVRKQWFKLARIIQRQRSSTLNTDKILRYTHAISHMQFVDFSLKTPAAHPDAQVYILEPAELTEIPLDCFTVYLAAPTPPALLDQLAKHLPDSALLVDYLSHDVSQLGLQPKRQLEKHALEAWTQVSNFFARHDIDMPHIANHDLTAMEDALDKVLGSYHEFLRLAGHLQHSLDLAQPLAFTYTQKRQFELCNVLAYRVQVLTHNAAHNQAPDFLNDYTYFLHDRTFGQASSVEFLAGEITRHLLAGRHRLAAALQQFHRLAIVV